MNILLVYPEMQNPYFTMKSAMRILGRKMTYAPLGLMTVASLLPEEWNKKLIDNNVRPLRDSDIRWADLVMISAMNVQVNGIKPIVNQCKKFGKKIAAGGPLFIHDHDKYPDIDFFILNEAEITLKPFIDDFLSGNPKKIYSSTEFADVSKSPLPDWSLIDKNDYAYGTLQYSRGCPYMCDFCDVTTLFGRRPRVKTAEQVIKELDAIVGTGTFENILFADDNLMGNKKILKTELLPALIEWRGKNRYAPGFSTQITINVADDDELLQLLLEAGFRFLFIGIESVSEESLKMMRKNQNTGRNVLSDLHKIQEPGFILMTGYILGLDSDEESVFEAQVNFIQESGALLNIINIIKAPPGTELYDRMRREDRLLPEFDFDEFHSNVITIMNEDVLINGLKFVMKNIHSPEAAFDRFMKYLSLQKKRRVKYSLKRKYSFYDILVLWRVLRYLVLNRDVGKIFRKLLTCIWEYDRANLDKGLFLGIIMLHQFEQWKRVEKITAKPVSDSMIEPIA